MEGDSNSVQCISIAFKVKKQKTKKQPVLADNHSSHHLLQDWSQATPCDYYLKQDVLQISRKAVTQFEEQPNLRFPDK